MAEDNAINIIVATVILLYLSVVTYNLFIHPLKDFPGPRTLAASRIPVTYASLKGIQTQWLHNLHLKYGPVVRVAPNEMSFIDEQAWKDIYSSSPTVPQSMKRGSDFFRYLEDDDNRPSILAADETDHPRIRRAYAPAFSRRALARQEPILAKYGDALIETLSGMEGQVTNIRDMFHYTLFEIVGHFQYGEEMGVLRTGARKSWVHSQPELLKASTLLSALADFTWINLLLRWSIPWMSKWLRKAYFKPSNDLIDHRLQIQSDEPDLVGLTFRNSRSSALTEKDIRANAHIMMLGGAETTLGLMTFLTACLLQHPECFARLKNEIRTSYHDKKEVSLESVSKLAYLDACIKEALRMYPPIPGAIHRVTPAGGASIAGHWVAGNTRVYIPIYAATHSPTHFWNPDRFIPDRWLEGAEGPYQKDIKAACHPFSTGPRGCIGQDMAYGMTKVVFCKFATEFNCELASNDTSPWLTGLRSWGTWDVPPLMLRVSRVEKASI
ncbi:cytochrome P450 [Aspergillus vadensis CBS 113365]|uniref:Cytochrome P450 n=1 Tax=Aspergillus vadensis (strain CBS 113365 / IMI 142717 / IBT 24658) TaxID=1448311 RepID=A0A319B857_ASPVC|nr:cytochrome P450 [Aspergillus vadensis CBS 113365]PYH69056.1 cytochrome P450 [Aspergillus vadensis CBS 113365]